MTSQDIISRIRKCLALAERGGTEEEAATAANMAAALAAKYSIDLAALQGVSGAPLRGFKEVVVFHSDTYEQWIMNLVGAVGQTYVSKSFFRTASNGEVDFCLLMREELADAARMIVEYLYAAVRRMNTVAVKGRHLSKEGRAEFRKAFRLSASQRLRMRLAKQAADMRTSDTVAQATVGHNALVVQDHFEREISELQEWMQDQGFDFKESKKKGPKINSYDGWEAGRKAGDSIGLDPQLSGTPTADHAKLIR